MKDQALRANSADSSDVLASLTVGDLKATLSTGVGCLPSPVLMSLASPITISIVGEVEAIHTPSTYSGRVVAVGTESVVFFV